MKCLAVLTVAVAVGVLAFAAGPDAEGFLRGEKEYGAGS